MHTPVIENNLHYLSQSNDSYTVQTYSGKIVTIAKAFSQKERTRKQVDFHDTWMKIAVIGLPLGGIPTVLLSPLVFWKNVKLVKNEHLTSDDRIHAKQLLVVSVISFLLSLVFFSLFIMHLLY